jgi:hypothetical protein
MLRIAAFAVTLLVSAAALAQNYSGTFTTVNPQGATVTLVLKQDAKKQVRGTLTGNNHTFQVAAEATVDGLMGMVTGPQGQLYLMGQFEGANLVVILAEPGPGGQPNLQAARRIVFAKTASAKPKADGSGLHLKSTSEPDFLRLQRAGQIKGVRWFARAIQPQRMQRHAGLA